MPAAIPLAIGAATAGQVGSAIIGSRASNRAAQQQSRAAEQALAVNRQVYGDQQRLMQPYIAAGNESLARLMSQHWGTPYQDPNAQVPGASSQMRGLPSLADISRPRPMNAPVTGTAIPRNGMSLASMAGRQDPSTSGQFGAMVTVEALDGSGAKPLPPHIAERALATGKFRRVG